MNSNESSRPLCNWGQKYRLVTKCRGHKQTLKVPGNLLKSLWFILAEEFLITFAVNSVRDHLSVTERYNLDWINFIANFLSVLWRCVHFWALMGIPNEPDKTFKKEQAEGWAMCIKKISVLILQRDTKARNMSLVCNYISGVLELELHLIIFKLFLFHRACSFLAAML